MIRKRLLLLLIIIHVQNFCCYHVLLSLVWSHLISEIGTAIIEFEELSKSVQRKREPLQDVKIRSIKDILNDDKCLSVSFVASVSNQLANYLRLLHESSIGLDKITDENIAIQYSRKKVTK